MSANLKLGRPGPRGIGLALYLLLAFASFLPLSLRPRDTVAYVGDSLESVYLVAWNVRQAFRAPARLFDAGPGLPLRPGGPGRQERGAGYGRRNLKPELEPRRRLVHAATFD